MVMVKLKRGWAEQLQGAESFTYSILFRRISHGCSVRGSKIRSDGRRRWEGEEMGVRVEPCRCGH